MPNEAVPFVPQIIDIAQQSPEDTTHPNLRNLLEGLACLDQTTLADNYAGLSILIDHYQNADPHNFVYTKARIALGSNPNIHPEGELEQLSKCLYQCTPNELRSLAQQALPQELMETCRRKLLRTTLHIVDDIARAMPEEKVRCAVGFAAFEFWATEDRVAIIANITHGTDPNPSGRSLRLDAVKRYIDAQIPHGTDHDLFNRVYIRLLGDPRKLCQQVIQAKSYRQ